MFDFFVNIFGKQYDFFSDGNCANMDKCKFCDISDIDLQSAWEMLNNLTQNRKYIVADFKNLQGIVI